MNIIPYRAEYFDKLISFMKRNWAENHAIYDKTLFDWQYRVETGHDAASLLLLNEEEIIGFLGCIPVTYAVGGNRVPGVHFAMWVIGERYRDSGLGILLIKEAEKRYSVITTLGINLKAVPLYQRMGYHYTNGLRRFVVPLDAEGYARMLPPNGNLTAIEDWCGQVMNFTPRRRTHSLRHVGAEDLERLYERSVMPRFALSVYRDADYWNWRYIGSQGYRYVFLGDPEEAGMVIVRIDRAYAPDNPQVHHSKVLRIMEWMPADGEVWNGSAAPEFISFMQSVLAWGLERGCVAADYQSASTRLSPALSLAGFRLQNPDYTPDECALAGLFQPYRMQVNPINMTWKVDVKAANGMSFRNVEDLYIVKPDGDMDRPNIWPLPEGWNEDS